MTSSMLLFLFFANFPSFIIIPDRKKFWNFYSITHRNMFTLSDISIAHAQVKTGADFPAYARSLIAM